MPERMTVPAPTLVMPKPVPLIAPDKVKTSPVAILIVLLAVKLMLPAKELVSSAKVPPLRMTALVPIVTLARFKVAPELMVTAPPVSLPRPLLLLMVSVPPLMVVVPL